MQFETENEMATLFKHFFNSNIEETNIEFREECKRLFGIPDAVFIEKKDNFIRHIVAFELKLKKWQRALIQAFKYKNFANQSFVIIDEHYITPAIKNIDKFIHFNIGIASFNKNKELKIFYYPKIKKPFSNEYYEKLDGINIDHIFNSILDDKLKKFCVNSNAIHETKKESSRVNLINYSKSKRLSHRDKFEFLLNGEAIIKNNTNFHKQYYIKQYL